MKLYLTKSTKWMQYCSHSECEEKPEHFYKTAKAGWRKKIKKNQVIGVVEMGSIREIYCRNCIDKLFADFKSVFDSKLWAFH